MSVSTQPARFSLKISCLDATSWTSFENPDRTFWGDRDLVAPSRCVFSIPDAPGDAYYANAVQLGDIPVQVTVPVRIGQTAPDFSMQGLDGASLKLSDFLGQYVLLNALIPETSGSLREIQKREILNQLHANYEATKKLAILSVVIPSSSRESSIVGPLEHLIHEEGLQWSFAVLGKATRRDFTSAYYNFDSDGIDNRYPFPLLIAPDGTVIDMDLAIDSLAARVQETFQE